MWKFPAEVLSGAGGARGGQSEVAGMVAPRVSLHKLGSALPLFLVLWDLHYEGEAAAAALRGRRESVMWVELSRRRCSRASSLFVIVPMLWGGVR